MFLKMFIDIHTIKISDLKDNISKVLRRKLISAKIYTIGDFIEKYEEIPLLISVSPAQYKSIRKLKKLIAKKPENVISNEIKVKQYYNTYKLLETVLDTPIVNIEEMIPGIIKGKIPLLRIKTISNLMNLDAKKIPSQIAFGEKCFAALYALKLQIFENPFLFNNTGESISFKGKPNPEFILFQDLSRDIPGIRKRTLKEDIRKNIISIIHVVVKRYVEYIKKPLYKSIIIERYLLDGFESCYLKKIGRSFNLSAERVRQIETNLLSDIRRLLLGFPLMEYRLQLNSEVVREIVSLKNFFHCNQYSTVDHFLQQMYTKCNVPIPRRKHFPFFLLLKIFGVTTGTDYAKSRYLINEDTLLAGGKFGKLSRLVYFYCKKSIAPVDFSDIFVHIRKNKHFKKLDRNNLLELCRSYTFLNFSKKGNRTYFRLTIKYLESELNALLYKICQQSFEPVPFSAIVSQVRKNKKLIDFDRDSLMHACRSCHFLKYRKKKNKVYFHLPFERFKTDQERAYYILKRNKKPMYSSAIRKKIDKKIPALAAKRKQVVQPNAINLSVDKRFSYQREKGIWGLTELEKTKNR